MNFIMPRKCFQSEGPHSLVISLSQTLQKRKEKGNVLKCMSAKGYQLSRGAQIVTT